MNRALCAVLIGVLACACSGPPVIDHARIAEIRLGLSTERDVRALIGDPDDEVLLANRCVEWSYWFSPRPLSATHAEDRHRLREHVRIVFDPRGRVTLMEVSDSDIEVLESDDPRTMPFGVSTS